LALTLLGAEAASASFPRFKLTCVDSTSGLLVNKNITIVEQLNPFGGELIAIRCSTHCACTAKKWFVHNFGPKNPSHHLSKVTLFQFRGVCHFLSLTLLFVFIFTTFADVASHFFPRTAISDISPRKKKLNNFTIYTPQHGKSAYRGLPEVRADSRCGRGGAEEAITPGFKNAGVIYIRTFLNFCVQIKNKYFNNE
jgi:hypothetical protein